MLQLWNEGKTQGEIAAEVGLHRASVTTHLRRLLGVETPKWGGSGRIAIRRPRSGDTPLLPPVVYPDNPPRLDAPCELSPGEVARFWSKVAAPNERGCRLWLKSVKRCGAGQFGTINSPAESAYRVAWRLTYGPIPEGKQVNHRCDVPACNEPTHLWLGTQAENMRDMGAKGRRRGKGGKRGEDNVTAKLTWEIVREIRRVREQTGATLGEIAGRFNISRAQACNITTYRQWVES